MLTQEKIDSLYSIFMHCDLATTSFLYDIGFSKYDLENLVKSGYLSRAKKGYYCLNLDNDEVCTKMFLKKIENKDYDDIFKYFKGMDKSLDLGKKQDNNLWLFLLSQIIEIPLEYRERLFKFEFGDVCNIANDLDSIEQYSKVRFLAFNHKFALARKCCLNINDTSDSMKILQSLLDNIYEARIDRNNYWLNYVIDKRYERLVSEIEKIKTYRPVSRAEDLTLTLARDVIACKKRIPNSMPGPVQNVTEAVKLRDYQKALSISMRKYNRCLHENIVYRLLSDLNKNISREKCFSELVYAFLDGNLDDDYKNLDSYLESNGFSRYKEYISDLVKLSLLEDDKTFTRPIVAFNGICFDELDFDVGSYIQDYFQALRANELEKAQIYLNIISQSCELGGLRVDVSELEEKLEQARFSNSLEKYSILDGVIHEILETKGLRVIEKLSSEDRRNVVKIANSFPDIMIELSGDDLVLRYIDTNKTWADFDLLLKEGRQAYDIGDYDYCIECLSTICANTERPDPYIYKKIGYAYSRRAASEDDYKRAIDYLTVAGNKGQYVAPCYMELKSKVDYAGEKVIQYVKK